MSSRGASSIIKTDPKPTGISFVGRGIRTGEKLIGPNSDIYFDR
jgi:hypothetical protein